MNNIITAVFTSGNSYTRLSGAWQYVYGQVLRLQGLQLPPAVEVHFSLTETGGESVTRIGVTQDGVTDVPVPDSLLENGNASHDYTIYVFLYLADGSAGNTEYKISLQVRSRPRPEVPGAPEEPGLFREAIEAVNKVAERAETAAGEAASSAVSADKSATEASGAATAAVKTEERIKQLEEDIKKVGQDAEDAVKQQETASKQAVTAHTDTEITLMQKAATEAESDLGESIRDAGTVKTQLDGSVEDAGSVQKALDNSISDAGDSKTALDKSIGDAGMAKTQLDKSIEGAGTGKTALDKSIGDARTLKTELDDDITAGSQLKTDLKTAGDTAVKAIRDEAETQLDKVQHASDDIIADREQIGQNKTDIEQLNANIANITPDDTAVGSKPWTSKHIVDMLCPPLEVTGNPVQCYPVPGYPLGITASWEPVQEGAGDPSPDNIRPIKGRDSITVMRYPKNILKNTAVSKEMVGVAVTVNNDGSVLLNGTSNSNFSAAGIELGTITFVQGVTYTISGLTGYTSKSLQLFTESSYAFPLGNRLACSANPTTETARKTETCSVKLYLYPNITYDNVVVYPMITIGGDKNEAYTPNAAKNTEFTLTIPETIYGGSVDAVTGEGESQYNKVNIRMENLNYNINISAMLGYASQNLLNDIQRPSSNSIAFDGVCDSLPTKSASEINSGAIGFGISASGDIYLKAEGLDSAEAYAAKFQNGVNVCYKVTTPKLFSATGNAPVPALSGINTVLTDADRMEVTGREDLIHAISATQAVE